MGWYVRAEQRIKAQVTDFQGTGLNHERIFSVSLRSHTSSLKTHWTCMAQPFTLQTLQPGTLLSSSRRPLADVEIRAEGLAPETRSSLGAGACPTAATQGLQLPPRSLSSALGAGHGHPNLNLSTMNPNHLCPVQPSFPAAFCSTWKQHSAGGQAEVCKGERERVKINKRMPAPLKEFSFIGSSPLPPFQ